MTAAMVVIELALMRGRYRNQKVNAMVVSGAIEVLALCFL